MIKKNALCIMVILLWISSAYAASGDIAGEYYYTDIKTTLNGVEIDAINIDGETLISAEDMHYYGFKVNWLADERVLWIDRMLEAPSDTPPVVKRAEGTAGKVRGYYYETDIVTKLDGVPVTAYNTGGRTYIHAEELRNYSYDVIWDAQKWELSVVSPERAGNLYDIPLTYDKKQEEQGSGNFSVTYTGGRVFGTGDAEYFKSSVRRESDGAYAFDMRFYQNGALYCSELLMEKLKPLAYWGYGVENEVEPSKKYEQVKNVIKFTINGIEAKELTVISGAGNGHRDFFVRAYDLPQLKKDEIWEIKISVGEPEGEPYEIIAADWKPE